MDKTNGFNLSGAEIFLAAIPERDIDGELFPEERARDVFAKKHPLARREGFFVWRLLELAVMQTFGQTLEEAGLVKSDGRWSARDFDISISHGGGALAVAISKGSVGIDLEPLLGSSDCEGIAHRFLGDDELSRYLSAPREARRETFLRIWTAKEAIFKSQAAAAFSPKDTDSSSKSVHTETVRISDRAYVISVATEGEVVIHDEIIL